VAFGQGTISSLGDKAVFHPPYFLTSIAASGFTCLFTGEENTILLATCQLSRYGDKPGMGATGQY